MSERMSLLIAYDGSDCADAALDDLRRAGLPPEADVVLLSVAEVWLPPPPPSSYEIVTAKREAGPPSHLKEKRYARASHVIEEARRLAERARERVQANFPHWKVRAEATCGSPAWEVIARADDLKPDLVIVGSHGRNSLGRFVLGSVSQKVLTEARCSVRIARGRVEVEESPVKIIIGMDGSPGSEAAVRAVAARRWPLKSQARVQIVEDPIVPTVVGNLVPQVAKWLEDGDDREWMQKMGERAVEQLRSAELEVSSSILTGDPKNVLVQEAEAWGADSIFVGSTGFSNRFERFLLGSVSASVAARAHCSVEVVREQKAG